MELVLVWKGFGLALTYVGESSLDDYAGERFSVGKGPFHENFVSTS
jgi:hypothetical protein